MVEPQSYPGLASYYESDSMVYTSKLSTNQVVSSNRAGVG